MKETAYHQEPNEVSLVEFMRRAGYVNGYITGCLDRPGSFRTGYGLPDRENEDGDLTLSVFPVYEGAFEAGYLDAMNDIEPRFAVIPNRAMVLREL